MKERSLPGQRQLIGGLFAGICFLLLSRAYYTFVFLPQHRDAAGEPIRLVEVEESIAYWQSPEGILFLLAAASSWGVALWGGIRVERGKKEERRLLARRKLASNHRERFRAAESGGCFSCCAEFPTEEITDWIQTRDGDRSGETALCPRCGNHTVIPGEGETDLQDLKKMHERWGAPETEESSNGG